LAEAAIDNWAVANPTPIARRIVKTIFFIVASLCVALTVAAAASNLQMTTEAAYYGSAADRGNCESLKT
jgi:hypothetical protein